MLVGDWTDGNATLGRFIQSHNRAGVPLYLFYPKGATEPTVMPQVAGNRLIGNRGYPGIVGDFRRSFTTMAGMRADVILPAHPELGEVFAHHAAAVTGRRDAFVDPGALRGWSRRRSKISRRTC